MTRLLDIAIINLLSVGCGLIVRAQESPPPLPPIRSLTPTTNRLTVRCSPVPNAKGYNFYAGTNENDLSVWQAKSAVPEYTFVFVSPWRLRPARWFFAVSAFDDVRESELSFIHWPAYPPILSGVRLSWDEPNHVTIQASADQANWTNAVTVDGNQVELPVLSPVQFYRDAAGVLALSIEPVFCPDPRDAPPAEIDDY